MSRLREWIALLEGWRNLIAFIVYLVWAAWMVRDNRPPGGWTPTHEGIARGLDEYLMTGAYVYLFLVVGRAMKVLAERGGFGKINTRQQQQEPQP